MSDEIKKELFPSDALSGFGHKNDYQIFKLEPLSESVAADIPQTLWLHIQTHIEYPPGYRHAWGSAYVSSDQEGHSPFPVQNIALRISMESPGGEQITYPHNENSSSVDASVQYYGAVLGSFHANFFAVATHPGYGTWSTQQNY